MVILSLLCTYVAFDAFRTVFPYLFYVFPLRSLRCQVANWLRQQEVTGQVLRSLDEARCADGVQSSRCEVLSRAARSEVWITVDRVDTSDSRVLPPRYTSAISFSKKSS